MRAEGGDGGYGGGEGGLGEEGWGYVSVMCFVFRDTHSALNAQLSTHSMSPAVLAQLVICI